MQEQANKSLHPLIWIAGIAVILLSVTGIGAIMGWIPASTGKGDDVEATAMAEQSVEPEKAAEPEKPAAARTPAVKTPSKTHVAQNKMQAAPAKVVCSQCGVVESVTERTQRGEGSGVGAVGGAVVGGLLGNQIGGGSGKDVATVVGALGGGYVGNEVEKRVKSTKYYEVRVRFEDGSTSVFKEATQSWRPGDRVKVVNNALRANN